MTADTISVLRGDTFVVSDRRGDVDASPSEPQGLFHQDTRFLSRWRLTVDGRSPNNLSIDDGSYFSTQFFLVPGTGTVYVDAPFSIIRRRVVAAGFDEQLTVINHAAEPLELELQLEADADFADLFEVKDALAKKGTHYREATDDRLVLGYRRGGFRRETWIKSDAPEAELSDDGLRFRLRIAAHGRWTTRVEVRAAIHAFSNVGRVTQPDAPGERELDAWLEAAPRLQSDWRTLELTYEQSLADLAALRFYPHILPDAALPAAGLPWFMTVFGRDSLITSFQALPFTPELAETTLRVLVARQGARVDDFRPEALLRLGRADDGRGRGRLQPDQLPQRNRLAARQLPCRGRACPLRLPGRGGADRLGDAGGSRVLPAPAAGGLRRLRARGDRVPGRVPDGLQPAGLGERCLAAARSHAPRPPAGRYDRSGAARRCLPN